ncbi:unnamed protein product [Lathyrus oleraceus]
MVRDIRSLLIVQILEDPRFISLHYRMCGWKKNHIEIGSEKLTRLKLQLQLASHQFRYELRASTDFVEGSWWMMKASLASPL